MEDLPGLLTKEAEKCKTTRSRGGLRQQPARPEFRSESGPQLEVENSTVITTAHNVVTQFDNTGTT